MTNAVGDPYQSTPLTTWHCCHGIELETRLQLNCHPASHRHLTPTRIGDSSSSTSTCCPRHGVLGPDDTDQVGESFTKDRSNPEAIDGQGTRMWVVGTMLST